MTSNDPERSTAEPKLNQPAAAPPVVDRNAFRAALAKQVAREKEVTRHNDRGEEGQLPGYSYYLFEDGVPYLTYLTTARGTEAILPTAHIMDRTVYGRQQDWENSPEGWPQYPTYG